MNVNLMSGSVLSAVKNVKLGNDQRIDKGVTFRRMNREDFFKEA